MSDATNLQVFQTALAHITGLGGAYQPTNPMLAVADNDAAYAAARALVDDFTAKLIPYKLEVNDREAVFKGSGKLATRVQAFVASCGADAGDIDDLKGFVRLVHGGRAQKIQIDDPNTPEDESKHVSVSQRGYSDVVEHWSKINTLLTNLGGLYKPNETELQLAKLQTMVTEMTAANQDVINAAVPKDNARDAKNQALYDAPDSLYQRLKLIKTYLKAAFGADANEYRAISGLQIVKPGK